MVELVDTRDLKSLGIYTVRVQVSLSVHKKTLLISLVFLFLNFDMLNINKIKKLSHLPFDIKKFLQFYPWRDCSPKNSIDLNKKLSECRVAIVSSAGLIVENEQEPFDSKIEMGDASFRVIPSNINSDDLGEYHRSNTFDHSGIKSNPFSAMPIPHLLDLVQEGFIGSINKRHLSLMGSIISPSKLIKETIPEIIDIFKSDKVDIAIFIPV